MGTRLYLAVVLLYFAGSALAQQDAGLATGYESLGQTQDGVRKALGSGRLLLSHDDNKYLLVPAKSATGEGPGAWSYGAKSLRPGESVEVDVQLGFRNGKPAYLPVFVPKDKAESASRDVKKLVEGAEGAWFSDLQVQSCSDGKECVKTCPDGKGGTYCCRWQCKLTP